MPYSEEPAMQLTNAQLTQIVLKLSAEVDSLKKDKAQYERVIAKYEQIIAEKDAIIQEQQAEIEHLKSVIRNLQKMLFGQRSEQTKYVLTSDDQLSMFSDAPIVAPELPETVVVAEHTRKKNKRSNEEMFDYLPNEDVIYDVPEKERFDKDGNPLEYIGCERIRRELHSETQKLKVKNIYVKCYGSKRDPVDHCRKTIVKGEAPPAFYPHSFATPSLVADILTKKYLYSMPLNRQQRYFKELGLDLPRNTMANWVIYVSESYLQPFSDAMQRILVQQLVIHADETRFQVLKESGKKPSSKSQFWVYTTSRWNPIQICCYEYRDSRRSECPEEYLAGYTGVIVADGFSGYNVLEDNVTRAGCWAHMRRYWYDAFPKDYKKSDTKREKLDESAAVNNVREPIQVTAFKYCNALFELEREFEDLDPEERRQQRQLRSKPVVEKYYQLVDSIQNPGGELKQAVTYATNQRSYLCAFLEDGNIEISNNAAERSIRNCVIGRKNWLFCDTPAGARASAAAYSVMATAKLNGLNVYNYVCYLLETLSQTPDDKRDETIASLMPWLPEMQAKFRLEKADTNQN